MNWCKRYARYHLIDDLKLEKYEYYIFNGDKYLKLNLGMQE